MEATHVMQLFDNLYTSARESCSTWFIFAATAKGDGFDVSFEDLIEFWCLSKCQLGRRWGNPTYSFRSSVSLFVMPMILCRGLSPMVRFEVVIQFEVASAIANSKQIHATTQIDSFR